MSYCFMRFTKIKTESHFSGAFSHNFRTMNVPNANPDLSHENEELIPLPHGKDYNDVFKDKIKEASGYVNSKPRRDAVKGLEFILAYNASTVDESFDFERWKQENVNWLKDTFGDNAVSAVLHMDEGCPHIHCVVIPIRDGRLNAKYYTGGKKAVSDLQSSYGKYMERVGLKRGLKYSKAEHIDISRYYAALNKTLDDELPVPKEGESAYEYRERANAIFIDSNLKHFGEMNAMRRKIDESKTMDVNDKIELSKLRKNKKSADKIEKQAKRFEEVLNGLKHGYFDSPEKNEEFKKQMQDISKWEREREKERNIEK